MRTKERFEEWHVSIWLIGLQDFFNSFFYLYRVFFPIFTTRNTCNFVTAVYFPPIQYKLFFLFFFLCHISMYGGSLHRWLFLSKSRSIVRVLTVVCNILYLFRPLFSPQRLACFKTLSNSFATPMGLSYILYPED